MLECDFLGASREVARAALPVDVMPVYYRRTFPNRTARCLCTTETRAVEAREEFFPQSDQLVN